MEDSKKKSYVESGGEKEILYSKAIKAGKRIYYMDVKKNLKGDMFLAITESKKIQEKGSSAFVFEKHKIFLYQEDFAKFMSGMEDVIGYVRSQGKSAPTEEEATDMTPPEEGQDDIKLDINFDSNGL